jgi:Ca2+/H+ antiporter
VLMNTAEQIILLVLAGAFTVFLILAIIAIVAVIRLIKTIQIVAIKAEKLVDSAEAVSAMVGNTVGKLSLLNFVHSVIGMVHGNGKQAKKGD